MFLVSGRIWDTCVIYLLGRWKKQKYLSIKSNTSWTSSLTVPPSAMFFSSAFELCNDIKHCFKFEYLDLQRRIWIGHSDTSLHVDSLPTFLTVFDPVFDNFCDLIDSEFVECARLKFGKIKQLFLYNVIEESIPTVVIDNL